MKRIVFLGIVILLVIIGAIWMDTRKTTKEIPEELEKCVCGMCDLDIFNCDCSTAREQREKLRR